MYKAVFFDRKGDYFSQDLYHNINEIMEVAEKVLKTHEELHINIYKQEVTK